MTPPVVDEKALHAAYKDMRTYVALDIMQEVVAAYLAHAPQPDLHKLIGQMEGMKVRMDFWSDEDFKSYSPNEAIDRCIALVRGEIKNEA